MSIFRRLMGRVVPVGFTKAKQDVQTAPVVCSAGPAMPAMTLKVDHVIVDAGLLVVAGWSSRSARFRVVAEGLPIPTTVVRTPRPDVASYLGVSDAGELGMLLIAVAVPDGRLELECLGEEGVPTARYPLRIQQEPLPADVRAQLMATFPQLREAGALGGAVLSHLEALVHAGGSSVSFAVGLLDEARASEAAGQAVVAGWLVCEPGVEAWLEDPRGRRTSLADAHWDERADVRAAVPPGLVPRAIRPGFIVRVDDVAPGDRIALVVGRGSETRCLAELSCAPWQEEPATAARWLLNRPTPMHRLAARMRKVDLPVIEAMQRKWQSWWAALPVQVEELGMVPQNPAASVVIPLHGRLDFVEHQLIEFSKDAWLRATVEIVYVVDDQNLVDRMAADAQALHRLYGVPFRWVWGGANRGYSGANNLGAAHARGRYLVFLNSDVFPRQPGWLQPLMRALEADAGIGAIGPRLLYGDGSIQHAGMTFERRHDLGIWVNRHPYMGLDPGLDPAHELSDAVCVTGACLAMRREYFDRVGGWDTGYLIGDFEDSDLCLKLRAAGLRIAYLPEVELTHLERQSFRLLGEGDYRTRVVVYNAVRHEWRWRDAIEAAAAAGGEGK